MHALFPLMVASALCLLRPALAVISNSHDQQLCSLRQVRSHPWDSWTGSLRKLAAVHELLG